MSVTTRYDKHPAFIVQTEEPFNGNAPLEFLCQEFVTSTDLFFCRNHGSIPLVDTAAYRLTVTGLVNRPLSLTLDELKTRFPVVEVMATLQCTGDHRDELNPALSMPNAAAGAISNANWTGVRLRDVLIAAGVNPQSKHIAFTGLDSVQRGGKTFGFGGSIPRQKAFLPETLLAFEMNGQPLLPVHGYPLRVVVPGYIGARSVKWLAGITVQNEPSDNYFQQQAFKLFPPDAAPENLRWEDGIMLGENSLNTVICYPVSGDTLPSGRLQVLGYAIGDGHNLVDQVQVSTDGKNWTNARFLTDNRDAWTWRLWEAAVDLPPGEVEILAQARDTAGNSQPQDTQEIWNFKGYSNNAWHRVTVRAKT